MNYPQNKETQSLPQTLPSKELELKTNTSNYPQLTDNLSLYLKEINKFPILTPEEEIELARRYHKYKDQEAAFKLITSNLRLVVKIAMDFQRKWMQNILDLIQEGNIGLMKAVQKFNPDKGIKFSYYASFWIKAYILKFIMDNWRMVKIGTTQAQRKLFYNLNKEKQRLEAMGITPDAETISANLNVAKKEVVEMGKRMGHNDLSLDTPLNDEEDFTPLHVIPALEGNIEQKLLQEETANILQEKIKTLLPKLNEKEKDILQLRLLNDNPLTLREIGEKYGITRERVRQIEARLLQKIKKHLKEEIADFSKDWILNA
ncbi:MAG: RNA polymerase factor sigma-32 [Desulfonauticus sp.]|nr:RNA polymerase factor sigma-32 [Desulfonauticus sp.]